MLPILVKPEEKVGTRLESYSCFGDAPCLNAASLEGHLSFDDVYLHVAFRPLAVVVIYGKRYRISFIFPISLLSK